MESYTISFPIPITNLVPSGLSMIFFSLDPKLFSMQELSKLPWIWGKAWIGTKV